MRFDTQEIVVKAGTLLDIYQSIVELNRNEVPIETTVQLHKAMEVVREHVTVYQDKWNEMIATYTDDGNIKTSHPDFSEWVKEAEEFNSQDITLDLPILSLDQLVDLDMTMSGVTLDVLKSAGIITD